MSRAKKIDTKEVGLDIGLILAKYFYKTDYLHYGYWEDNLKLDANNVAKSMENYVNYLKKKIPPGVQKVLDVGSGSGKFARNLLDEGYQVDCVSPSPNLTKHVRKNIENRGEIFACLFEQVKTKKTYDLVLFSESFQYIPLDIAIGNAINLLKPGGYLLICDFFRKPVEGKSPISGGHDLSKFYHKMEEEPFHQLINEDITEYTAPNMDLVNGFLMEVLHPIYQSLFYILDNKYPKLSKFIKWKFRKKLDKISEKYFQDKCNGDSFKKYKSYHCLLYQKVEPE